MKHRLTALIALAAVVAVPTLASAAEPLIYPDIPAKVSMDDHLAVIVPRATAATAQHATAVIVPRNGDPAEADANAEHIYLTSECPSVLSHPGDYSSMLKRFCQIAPG